MKARLALAITAALALAALAAPPASAAFGLKGLSLGFQEADGSPATGAGTHPYALRQSLEANTVIDPKLGEVPEDAVKDLVIHFPAGMVGNPTAMPPCSGADFALIVNGAPSCSAASAIGTATVRIGVGFSAPSTVTVAVYNLEPPPGAAAKIGFVPLGVPVTAELGLNPDPPHNVIATLTNVAQPVRFYGAEVEVWGNPASAVHDADRGRCATDPEGTCPVSVPEKPFLTMPRSCTPQLTSTFAADSWQSPGAWLHYQVEDPAGTTGCAGLGLAAQISSRASTEAAQSATGLSFELNVSDPGLTAPTGSAGSDIKKAVVTLPEGMTVNPSIAEGLATCSEAQLARESAFSAPGEGCPQAAKVGELEVQTPILEGKLLRGEVFVATQHANPFDSLLALYMVIRDPGLGVIVRLAGRVEPDPATGQLTTTFGAPGHELPQIPFSEFRFRFREGARAPLITPPLCGAHTTRAVLTPWANPAAPVLTTASFQISQGPGGAPCPPGGAPPFEPGFEAGTLDNAAGRHSPFLMRLTRRDADQDLTRFDAVLPPGALAKLAGVGRCPEAAIAAARGSSGREELASPSCPPQSRIGSTLAGAGVGSALTYVPGSLYLAGPFGGAPLSVVAIVPAVAGPFDVGTVVVRQALSLDPRSAQARVDGAASEPIPHILAGIPLSLREIRVSVDRPDFTLNPTSCAPKQTLAGIWGGGADPFSLADDLPVARSARFQAASCASLGFKPRLAIRLRGGARRGAHPALRAIVTPRPGQANFSRAAVTLPSSAFLEQGHIRTICTRVQFAAGAGHGSQCPKGAIYGYARAWSPLLDAPAQGPVYLRSSDNKLPDLVVALTGPPSAPVDVELSARIDSVRGGIRSVFTAIPDVPVSRFVLAMQGGRKGLIVNSRHLCRKPARNRARANLRGQNGRVSRTTPVVRALECAKKQKRRKAKRSSHRGRGSR